MLFFDVKRVLIAVVAIIGILATVIVGFLYAGGLLIFDPQDELYQGVLDGKYMAAAAEGGAGDPLDTGTLDRLHDANRVDASRSFVDGETDDEADGTEDRNTVRVLLFLRDGELAASGVVAEGSGVFALVKSVNLSKIKTSNDFPHMNEKRDMLSYGEVDDIVKAGGYFRAESEGRYLSSPIFPKKQDRID
jgi:hypothetical protein